MIRGVGLVLSILTLMSVSFEAEEESPPFQVFTIEELVELIGEESFRFLDEPSFSAEILRIPSEFEVIFDANPSDNVYYLVQGIGQVRVGDESFFIEPAHSLFVRRGHDYSFSAGAEDLVLIRVSLKQNSAQTSPEVRSFSHEQITQPRSPNRNVWNPFLRESNVIFGLYMLPEVIGGDSRLVHTFDELNIVLDGPALFEVDGESVEIDSGSIMFVRAGLGHYFHSLEADNDTLILWEQP